MAIIDELIRKHGKEAVYVTATTGTLTNDSATEDTNMLMTH
jgi:hypothetical protein